MFLSKRIAISDVPDVVIDAAKSVVLRRTTGLTRDLRAQAWAEENGQFGFVEEPSPLTVSTLGETIQDRLDQGNPLTPSFLKDAFLAISKEALKHRDELRKVREVIDEFQIQQHSVERYLKELGAQFPILTFPASISQPLRDQFIHLKEALVREINVRLSSELKTQYQHQESTPEKVVKVVCSLANGFFGVGDIVGTIASAVTGKIVGNLREKKINNLQEGLNVLGANVEISVTKLINDLILQFPKGARLVDNASDLLLKEIGKKVTFPQNSSDQVLFGSGLMEKLAVKNTVES